MKKTLQNKLIILIACCVFILSGCTNQNERLIVEYETRINQMEEKLATIQSENKILINEISELQVRLDKLLDRPDTVDSIRYYLPFFVDSTIEGKIIEQLYENSILTSYIQLPFLMESVAYRFMIFKGKVKDTGIEYDRVIIPNEIIESSNINYQTFKLQFQIEKNEVYIILVYDVVSSSFWTFQSQISDQGDI